MLKNKLKKQYLVYILLVVIVILGLTYRFIGIQKGLSYWNDEDHVALYARGILQSGLPINDYGQDLGIYQVGLFYITALFFNLLDNNELVGRLPSVLIGTFLICAIFFIVKKILGTKEAIVAATLMSFSQMQLAWSTQLRPYIWMELYTVIITYFCYLNVKQKNIIDRNIICAFFIAILSTLFHGTGVLNFILISMVLLFQVLKQKQYKYIIYFIPIVVVSIVFIVFSFPNAILKIFYLDFDITHYMRFFIKNYIWLLSGSAIGAYALWKTNRNLLLILCSFIVVIFTMAIFKLNARYVRYSITAFPLLYILFSIGFIYTIDTATKNIKNSYKSALMVVAISLLFFSFPLYTNKLIVIPQNYYSINADVRENPIVDYKTAFGRIKKLIHGKDNVVIMDAWNDRVPYYLPNQPFILLMKDTKTVDPQYGEKIVGTIHDYEKIKAQYKSGIVLIENWESLTPIELQNHMRSTLKHEFDVNNLPYNENDKWSISIYSWGL